jgi:hypothetical protein
MNRSRKQLLLAACPHFLFRRFHSRSCGVLLRSTVDRVEVARHHQDNTREASGTQFVPTINRNRSFHSRHASTCCYTPVAPDVATRPESCGWPSCQSWPHWHEASGGQVVSFPEVAASQGSTGARPVVTNPIAINFASVATMTERHYAQKMSLPENPKYTSPMCGT